MLQIDAPPIVALMCKAEIQSLISTVLRRGQILLLLFLGQRIPDPIALSAVVLV